MKEQNDSDFFIVLDKGLEESEELFNKKLKSLTRKFMYYLFLMGALAMLTLFIGVYIGRNIL